jgi:hypothetical protein
VVNDEEPTRQTTTSLLPENIAAVLRGVEAIVRDPSKYLFGSETTSVKVFEALKANNKGCQPGHLDATRWTLKGAIVKVIKDQSRSTDMIPVVCQALERSAARLDRDLNIKGNVSHLLALSSVKESLREYQALVAKNTASVV